MDVIFPSTKCVGRAVSGHSLVELMFSLSIALILTSFAVPAFSNLLHDDEMSSQVNKLVGSLYYARTEAIKRRQRVNICKSPDGNHCDNGAEWDDGWLVFVDMNADKQHQNGEPTLGQRQIDNPRMQVDYGAFPTDNYVVFYPTGRSPGNGTFTFCDARGAKAAHAVVLHRTGRVRTTEVMPDGSPLTCP